jgi:hypothetical protein
MEVLRDHLIYMPKSKRRKKSQKLVKKKLKVAQARKEFARAKEEKKTGKNLLPDSLARRIVSACEDC